MYKLAICDDDMQLCNQIESDILLYGKMYQKVFDIDIYTKGENLLKHVHSRENYDFMILDICLKDTTGIEIGKQIRNINKNYDVPIIYISSFKDYALQLFKIRPFDFLLKPIKKDELFSVMDEICKKLDSKKHYFSYKHGTLYSRIPYSNIIYFYSTDKKVSIVTLDKTEEFWGKLKDVESQTQPYFLLIHKSFLINYNYVKKYNYDSVEMSDGRILSISQRKRKGVRDTLLELMKENKS